MTGAWIAAAATGLAVVALVPFAPVADQRRAPGSPSSGVLRRSRVLLALLCVPGGWAVVGGAWGVIAGCAGGALAWRVLGSAEEPAARRRREQLERDLPFAVHLLASCLRSGAAVSSALDDVAAAMGGPVAEELGHLRARLVLGADPVAVWERLAAGGPLAPLGRAFARAHRSGSSVSAAVERLSDDLRAGRHTRTRARARTVEVRAAVPLGVCLLPAFLLLGVVPLTVALFSSLDLLG